MKKIGMLTSGGDCQALNAAMRGVVKALAHNVDELEIYGFENGYKGLIYENYRILTSKVFHLDNRQCILTSFQAAQYSAHQDSLLSL